MPGPPERHRQQYPLLHVSSCEVLFLGTLENVFWMAYNHRIKEVLLDIVAMCRNLPIRDDWPLTMQWIFRIHREKGTAELKRMMDENFFQDGSFREWRRRIGYGQEAIDQ